MTAARDSGTFGQTPAMPVSTTTEDPELHHPFYHQRGRRRRRSPLPSSPHDGVSVPFALTMTPTAMGSPTSQRAQNPPRVPPRPKNRPRPRQETPSGSSGTFRGRRRHRSPSLGPASVLSAAIRKASSRPPTRSSSVASSMKPVSSRPSSPHEWWGVAASSGWTCRSISRSRGRDRRGPGGVNSNGNAKHGPESSPSPQRRRLASFHASIDVDHHGVGHHYATTSHDYSHHHLLVQARHYTKPVSRRSHCPSRSGSAEGYHLEEEDTAGIDPIVLASRRRRRRQRTQSRPRPRRAITGDSLASAADGDSNVFGLTSYYMLDNGPAVQPGAASNESKPGEASTCSSRLQFLMLLGESSDPTSDGDSMDVEMG
ncbi:hypothetical protein SCUCBS95973_000595 [Sporothrix curviconia]|uniref:Uncharacterized protein n=1 Tax=Sporothrix curviconia TaxID=1260050 RepID=A0ABP0ARL0_9PEZI